MTEERLADVARRLTGEAKYQGFKNKEELRLHQHREVIRHQEEALELEVTELAKKGNEAFRVLQLDGFCVAHSEKTGKLLLKCDDCLAFSARLRLQGFNGYLTEDKYFYYLVIDWR